MGMFGDLYSRLQPNAEPDPVVAADRLATVADIYDAIVEGTLPDWPSLVTKAGRYGRKYTMIRTVEIWLSQAPVLSDSLALKDWADRCPWPPTPTPQNKPKGDPFKKFRL